MDIKRIGILERECIDYQCIYQRSGLHLPGAVPMFHQTVVFKKTHVVDRSLNPQDQPVLVIHLDGGFAHMMFDARAWIRV